jgi:hypothetical protein
MRPLAPLATCLLLATFASAEEGFTPLFDGKTLAGWRGNEELWSVKDGAIFGKTDGNIPDNTFLIHEGEFKDFILKIKFKLHGHKGNSGVMYRSQEHKGEHPFVMAGFQADIADDKHMGILYGEKTGRGIIVNLAPEQQAKVLEVLHKDDWNEYVITAEGDHVTQTLNGYKTVDVRDAEGAKSGAIALQLHRNRDMEISFKDILIKELP